tara:strand:- start:16736 stop:17731 length:996 start_codon:yes stop_codon:yes gene_type:complete
MSKPQKRNNETERQIIRSSRLRGLVPPPLDPQRTLEYAIEGLTDQQASGIFQDEVEQMIASDNPSQHFSLLHSLGELPPSQDLLERIHVPVYIDTLVVNSKGKLWKSSDGNPALSVTVNFNRPPVQVWYRKRCVKQKIYQSYARQYVEDHFALPGTFEHHLALFTKHTFFPPPHFTLEDDVEAEPGPATNCGIVAYTARLTTRTTRSSQQITQQKINNQFEQLQQLSNDFVSMLYAFFVNEGFETFQGHMQNSGSSHAFYGLRARNIEEKMTEAKGFRDIRRFEVFATRLNNPNLIIDIEHLREFQPLPTHAHDRVTTRGNIPASWFSLIG